jgi:hypothetical protein
MKYMSKEQFFAAHEGYGFISKALEQLGEEFLKNFSGDRVVSIDYYMNDESSGEIELQTSTRMCSCCYPDERDYFRFPIDYLWDENWIQREKDRREQERLESEREAAEEKAQKEKEHQAKRYQQFLEMKEEFEQNG